jgi:hypothetical protein
MLSHTFTGLAGNTTYTFSVAAINGTGTGLAATAMATTADVAPQPPSAPQGFTATPHSSLAAVLLQWSPPADPGTSTVDGYQISVDGAVLGVVPAEWADAVVNGLSHATTYQFTIRATSAAGLGAPASAQARTAAAPSQPVITHATQTAVTVPKKVKKGKRPTVKVEVTSTGGVPTGSVRITVGKKSVVRTLSGGAASYKAPKQKKVGKVKVTVTYLGTSTFKGSTATRKFKVRR